MEEYKRKNPILNKELVNDITNLKKDISKLKNVVSDKYLEKFIIDIHQAEFLLPLEVRGSGIVTAFSPCLLDSPSGTVLPIFTNLYELYKTKEQYFDHYNWKKIKIYVLNFEEIKELYGEISNSIANLVINPSSTNFILTDEIIELADQTYNELVLK